MWRLWEACHRRLERTGGRRDGATVTIASPSDDERAAIDRLLGRRSRGRDLTLRLADVDSALHRTGTSLADVVTAAVGVIEDRPGARSASAAADAAMWSLVAAHSALAQHEFVSPWLSRLRSTGRWRRLDDPPRRLREALDVLAALPVLERTGRSRLAVEVLGDAHALDDTALMGRLVISALAEGRAVSTAAARRDLWARYGVVADETSSTVLTIGLRPIAVGPVTEGARRWADGRVPLVIPLAAVDAEAWRLSEGARVWVCENPSVVAVATGIDAPVVCVEGQPSLAATRLLSSLAAGGVSLAYHGDFGAGGVAIANTIIGGLGAQPWRMSTTDHAAALARAESAGVALRPLRGTVPAACWDGELAPAINVAGVEVEEELVLDLLVADMSARSFDRGHLG
jgi:uncharacterized protein (TIGR02679 family)